MSDDEFAQWLVGTRWKETDRRVTLTFVSDKSVLVENRSRVESITFGYDVVDSKIGEIKLPWAALPSSSDKLTISEDLKAAKWTHYDGKKVTPLTFVEKVSLPPLGKGKLAEMTTEEFEKWIQSHQFRAVSGNNHLTFLPNGRVIGFAGNNDPNRVSYEVALPGLVHMKWINSSKWLSPILLISSDMKEGVVSTKWNSFRGTLSPISNPPASTNSGMNLSELPPVQIKNQIARTQALLLSPMGNSRYAAQASKLSLTALKVKNSDAASIGLIRTLGK